jgi:hypothetical protein
MRRSLLWIALLCHLALATAFLLRTPSFEAPDENSHYEYAWFLANTGELPLAPGLATARGLPQTAGAVLAHHPPLYYALLAAVLTAAGRGDTVFAPRLNAQFGVPDQPAKALRFEHGSGQGDGPLLLLRAFSVLLGALTVLAVHRLGRRCCPSRPQVADLAALLTASLPMFAFLHGSLNSDVSATLLCTATIATLAGIWQRERTTRGDGVRLGLLLGAALLTKLTTLFLLPLATLTLVLSWWRTRRLGGAASLVTLAIALLFAFGISGFWFWRNWQLYGDPLALSVHDAAFTPIPPELRWHWFFGTDPWPTAVPSFLPTVFRSLLGHFGWFSLPPPGWLPWLALGIATIAFAGLLRLCLPNARHQRVAGAWLLLSACALVFAGTAHFNWKAPQPQGRLLLPAVGPAAVLLAAGLVRVGGALPFRRWLLLLPPAVAFGVFLSWFWPAFAPELAPAPPWHRALVGGIATPSGPIDIRWSPELPPEGTTPPLLRWADPDAQPATNYTLYATDARGRVYLASHEWSGGALPLSGTAATLPEAGFEFLPRGVPLLLRLRRVPRTADDDPAELPTSPPHPFVRR